MKTYNERTEQAYKKAAEMRAKKKKLKIFLSSAVSVCLCCLIAVNLVVFLPRTDFETPDFGNNGQIDNTLPPDGNNNQTDVTKPSDDDKNGQTEVTPPTGEYAGIYNKVRAAAEGKTDALDFGSASWEGASGDVDYDGDAAPAVPDSPSNSGTYEEVTDNQVDGVIEGDLFKRSSTHIFYLTGGVRSENYGLRIYSIEKENSKLVSFVEIPCEEKLRFSRSTRSDVGIFLSSDCKTVTVIVDAYNSEDLLNYTAIYSVDVSDVNAPKLINTLYVSGYYVSARLVNGKFLLVTNFYAHRNPDFSNKRQFIPHTGELDNSDYLPADRIICPENPSSVRYTVICSIDEKTLHIDDSYAFLSYSNVLYVSADNIFVSRNYIYKNHDEQINDKTYRSSKSEISCISYDGEKLNYINSVTLTGTILNQYSMDEYEGTLRVATTVRLYEAKTYYNSTYYSIDGSLTNANVYCVSLESFEIIGSLERFAPDGETIRSARFDGNTAYVCTSVERTDPVFAIDLSDPENITFKDTGTIPGYSMSLTKFYGDTLLGIGYGDSNNPKIEIYKETEGDVTSVAVYEMENQYFADDGTEMSRYMIVPSNYKAYFIDAENGLIGLSLYEYYMLIGVPFPGAMTYSHNSCTYVLFKFDGENLTLLTEKTFMSSPYWTDYSTCCSYYTRSTYIDGYMYIVNDDGITVFEID